MKNLDDLSIRSLQCFMPSESTHNRGHTLLPQPAIPILGMHRSGTSLLTRMLSLCGLHIGTHMGRPGFDNPKGFWEDTFFGSMNVNLLKALDVSIDGFGTLEILHQINAQSRKLRLTDAHLDSVRDYIHHFFTQGPWGWKDPRSLLLFPFWKSTLHALGIEDVRPVVVVRHPETCVRSLLAREQRAPGGCDTRGLSLEEIALSSWTAYNRFALDVLENDGGIVTLFEWLTDPKTLPSELVRLSEFLGLEQQNARTASAFLDQSLVHHAGVNSTKYTNEAAEQLYAMLRSRVLRTV